MSKICHKIVLISTMRNICARFAQDLRKICARLHYFPSAQYMRKIWARLYLFPQCAIYEQDFPQDCTYFHNTQYMCEICTGLYLFPQCAIYAQDLRKIVPISPMCNICTTFAQDCTSLPNVQYRHKIADIIGRNMSHITYVL